MKKNSNKVRIIAGSLRGRQVNFPDHDGLRPTGDRLRESLFSWLHESLPGAHCLDLFAGSGVLGFEAISRGAASVVLAEKSTTVCRALRANAQLLGIDNIEIECADSTRMSALQNLRRGAPFDIVFIDPPFSAGLHQITVDALQQAQVLADQAIVSVESGKRNPSVQVPQRWNLQREKVAGEVRLQLFRVEAG